MEMGTADGEVRIWDQRPTSNIQRPSWFPPGNEQPIREKHAQLQDPLPGGVDPPLGGDGVGFSRSSHQSHVT